MFAVLDCPFLRRPLEIHAPTSWGLEIVEDRESACKFSYWYYSLGVQFQNCPDLDSVRKESVIPNTGVIYEGFGDHLLDRNKPFQLQYVAHRSGLLTFMNE